MSRLSPRVEAVGFAILSGLISFFYNVVMIVVPLRMSDHGLPYAVVGGAMSAVSIGLIVVKLAIGHLSDLFGSRRFILTALLGLAIAAAGLGTVENLWGYILLWRSWGCSAVSSRRSAALMSLIWLTRAAMVGSTAPF